MKQTITGAIVQPTDLHIAAEFIKRMNEQIGFQDETAAGLNLTVELDLETFDQKDPFIQGLSNEIEEFFGNDEQLQIQYNIFAMGYKIGEEQMRDAMTPTMKERHHDV